MSYTAVPLRIQEHREAILRLWKDTSGYDCERNPLAEKRFKWLYEETPADLARTWLAVESESGVVVGCGSVFRSDRYVRGTLVRTGMPAVFMVDRNHRSAAAALAIQRAIAVESCHTWLDLLIGRPGNSIAPIFERVGYRAIGNMRNWMRYISPDDAIFTHQLTSDYQGTICSAADGRFDQMCQVTRTNYTIVGAKTLTFLNWRYSSLSENYLYFCLSNRLNDSLAGYVVFYTMKDGVVITEALCENPAGAMLDLLICEFASQMANTGRKWIYLSYFGAPSFEDKLRQFGFEHGKPRKVEMYLRPGIQPAIGEAVVKSSGWFLFGEETFILLSHKIWPEVATGSMLSTSSSSQ